MRERKESAWKGKDVTIDYSEENSLIAVQGPMAMNLLEQVLGVKLTNMDFMEASPMKFPAGGVDVNVSRTGYTGEDGFEVSVPGSAAEAFAAALEKPVDGAGVPLAKWIGLGARDTLRLEAGLCLYGHELEENISPVEAMLGWTISKRRKENGGFLGFDTVKKQLTEGVK